MASVKVKQDDLRRLMKEKRENLQNQKTRIDSPFAKYNSIGQLSCTICNVQIKSNALWTTHVAGKIHKENALKKRKRTADVTSNSLPSSSKKTSDEQPPVFKKPKVDTKESSSIVETEKSVSKLSLMEVYSSSSEDEDGADPEKSVSNAAPNNVLPADFFDATPAPAPFPVNQEKNAVGGKKPASVPANTVEALPEGFFDDPVLDAKARNMEYKDPKEEEWEKYLKAIAEETNVSKTIIEEDFEEITLERDITDIDLQINLWEKAKTLQTNEEARSNIPTNANEKESSSSTDDELEEDDLLDWRSKGVKKK